jgi:YVTN family beta-propeller protein
LIGIFSLLLAMAVGGLSANAQSFVYVANNGDNTVSVISTTTNTVVATVPVGVNPWGLAITPNGAFAYVTNLGDNTVSVINTNTNTIVATVSAGAGPAGVAITPNGTFAYVANSVDNTVSVVNTATNSVVGTVPVGPGPSGLAITPNGAFAYVVNSDNTVSVINTATNTVVATVSVPGCGFGNDGPGLSITPNGASVYVSKACGEIGVINTATNTVVATFSTTGTTGPGPNLYFVGFAPNGAFAYAAVGGFSYVSVFDTSNTVVAKVPVGAFPVDVAVTPDGSLAYVTNNHSNTVSVIDTAANAVVATVPVGVNPFGVAITRFLDNDSQFSVLNAGNTFTGNQTVNGTVNATNFAGNGAGLTGVAATTAATASGLSCAGCVGNAQLGINYATSPSQGGSATNALALNGQPSTFYAKTGANTFTGNQAMPSLTVMGTINSSLGNFSNGLTGSSSVNYEPGVYGVNTSTNAGVYGYSASGVGTGGQSNIAPGVLGTSGTGNGVQAQTSTTSATAAAGVFDNTASGNILLGRSAGVTKFSVDGKGDVAASGSVTIGTGGTPILEHLSQTISLNVAAAGPATCAPLTSFNLTGASDGDSLALGVPNSLLNPTLTGAGILNYSAWVSAANTITIRVCNVNPNGPKSNAVSGTIRVDIWKH